ncbi:MAG: sulfatase-like hydrolase/transferase [Candidatus Riflebacteria bacterium]|nr:sulfatase-like hydrolase/transferase [Candidatus Riflebacteria bacterium]
MKTLSIRLAAFWHEVRVAAVSTLALLFAIRMLSIILNLQTNLGELWRPRLDEPEWGRWLVIFLLIPLIIALQSGFSKLSGVMKNRYLGFHALSYLTMGLFNNVVDHRCYLYQLFDGRLDFDALQSLIVMDIFFQAPGLFWGLAWMALSLYVASKNGNKNWLPLLWVLPFFGFSYFLNNLLIVFFFAATAATLVAFLSKQQESSRAVYLYQAALFVAILAFLAGNPIIYRSSWLAAIVLLPLCWLPGYWFIRHCEVDNSKEAMAMTWLIPVFAGGLLSQVLFNAPLAKSLFNFWYIFASFNYAAGALSWLAGILTFAFLAGLAAPRLSRPVFYISAGCAALFFLVDGILLYKSGMRPGFETINWVWGLANLSSIVATATALVDLKIAGVILITPLLFIGFYSCVRKRVAAKRSALSQSAVYLLITAQLSLTGYQMLTDYPSILRDPVRNLLASLPLPMVFQPEKPGLIDLLQTFSDCGVTFPQISGPQAQPGKVSTGSKNIILIMLESTSNKYLSLFGHNEKTWPEMEKYKDRMEIFPFVFSCFPESSNADFAVMSGMFPPGHLFLRQKPEFNHPTLIEKLKNSRYDCFMYFSGFIGDTGLYSFYRPRGFKGFYDAVSLPDSTREDGWVWGIKEHVMVDRISDLLEKVASEPQQPFFIYYRMLFPHSPFDRVTEDPPVFSEDDYFQGSWLGRYKNCLLYQDRQLARLVQKLDTTGLAKNTLVIAIGDHGTMLGENGMHGHGWNLEPELVNVPLIIIRPESAGFKINQIQGSQADIQPTILDLAGIADDLASFAQGRSLVQKQIATRSIYLSSLMHRAMIEDDHYFLFPIENSANAKVYRLNKDQPGTRFTGVSTWSSEDLWAKHQRLNRFLSYQNHLLSNIEHYEHLYNRR